MRALVFGTAPAGTARIEVARSGGGASTDMTVREISRVAGGGVFFVGEIPFAQTATAITAYGSGSRLLEACSEQRASRHERQPEHGQRPGSCWWALIAGVVVWAAQRWRPLPASVGASAGGCASQAVAVKRAGTGDAGGRAADPCPPAHCPGRRPARGDLYAQLTRDRDRARSRTADPDQRPGRTVLDDPRAARVTPGHYDRLPETGTRVAEAAHPPRGLQPDAGKRAQPRRVHRTLPHTHAASPPPGVIVFTQGQIVQGADSTLTAIQNGSAFTTGECAGPGHNLLTVSGLAPAATSTIQLRSQTGPRRPSRPATAPTRSYSHQAPTQPDSHRLVLLNGGHRIATLTIPGGSFSTHHCTTGATHGPSSEPSKVISAGFTVIAANPHGPEGVGYTLVLPPADPRRATPSSTSRQPTAPSAAGPGCATFP